MQHVFDRSFVGLSIVDLERRGVFGPAVDIYDSYHRSDMTLDDYNDTGCNDNLVKAM